MISKLRTLWIALISAIYMVDICGRSVLKSRFSTSTREWVNKTLRNWAKRTLNLIGVKCVVINPYNVAPQPGTPTIIMCNHSSLYDIPISLQAFPDSSVRMLTKKEMYKWPIIGKGMVAAEFPFIDRHNRSQAMKDLEIMQKLLQSGIVLWVAPEGTRSRDGKLAQFKKGSFITAITTKATIIPIGIRGAHDILPARTYRFNLNQTAEIHIGQAIDAAEYTLENKEELIRRVFDAIHELAGQKTKD